MVQKAENAANAASSICGEQNQKSVEAFVTYLVCSADFGLLAEAMIRCYDIEMLKGGLDREQPSDRYVFTILVLDTLGLINISNVIRLWRAARTELENIEFCEEFPVYSRIFLSSQRSKLLALRWEDTLQGHFPTPISFKIPLRGASGACPVNYLLQHCARWSGRFRRLLDSGLNARLGQVDGQTKYYFGMKDNQ